MALSKKERVESRQSAQEAPKQRVEKKSNHMLYIFLSFLVIVIISGTIFGIVQAQKPGPLDDFAKCLHENNAVMYGAGFCEYSKAQKNMFGRSKKHLDYRDYTENEEVSITPTWYINGEKIENVQTLQRLAQLSGCTLPGYEQPEEDEA